MTSMLCDDENMVILVIDGNTLTYFWIYFCRKRYLFLKKKYNPTHYEKMIQISVKIGHHHVFTPVLCTKANNVIMNSIRK
jgi:hypothetical protein